MSGKLKIGSYEFDSRLFVGTGKFSSVQLMVDSIRASGAQMVTMSIKRVDLNRREDHLLAPLKSLNLTLLPNTAGARTAREAVFAACLAKEALGTDLIKLEVHPDPKYLLPDPVETLKATEELVQKGFTVLPYCQADPVLCKRLADAGCPCVMPLAAPIGSNQGLKTLEFLKIIIEQSTVPVVVDAGIGAPSHAARAMELGADAVLVNTAIAVSGDPVAMAGAFELAVRAGRVAYEAGLGRSTLRANATSNMEHFLSSLE